MKTVEPSGGMHGTIHLHVKQDGRLFALSQASNGLRWQSLTFEQLQTQLEPLRGKAVGVAYSRDDPKAEPSKLVETVFKVIMSYGLPLQLLRDPPVPPP